MAEGGREKEQKEYKVYKKDGKKTAPLYYFHGSLLKPKGFNRE